MDTNTNSTNIIKYEPLQSKDEITITVLLAFTGSLGKSPKNDLGVHHLFLTPNLVHQIHIKKLKDNTAPTRNLKPRRGNNSPLTNQTAAALLNNSIT